MSSGSGAAPAPAAVPTPELALLTLDFTPWCDVFLDGAPAGRANRAKPLHLPPGRHTVRCTQGPGLASWSGDVTLAPGERRTLRADLLSTVTVRIDLPAGEAVQIGAAGRFVGGQTAILSPRRYSIQPLRGTQPVGDATYYTFRVSCTLRFHPTVDCVPDR